MTNQELQKVIELAKEYKIKINDLKMLLKLFAKKDGHIYTKQLSDIEYIMLKGFLNDKELKIILERLLNKGYSNWHRLGYLSCHPILKKYLSEKDFSNEVWNVIFYNLRNMPRDNILEKLYCEKLELYYANSEKEELNFFGEFFEHIMSYSLIFKDWIWEYFFDKQKSLNERKEIFYIILRLNNEMKPEEANKKAKKIIKCYELYGEKLATSYARALNKLDLEVPTIIVEEERSIFINLYDFLFFKCRENTAINYLNSSYYKILTDKTIIAKKRLEFARNLDEGELVLKNNIVNLLWHTYLEQGLDAMNILKYSFLNNGIRTNILCKTFLEQETNIEVLKLARKVFRNNRIRKDTENLCILNDLQTSEEKINFLNYLESKYPDISEETKQQLEKEAEERQVQENEVQKSYNAFLSNKIGLRELEKTLEESKNIRVILTRTRKNERRKI